MKPYLALKKSVQRALPPKDAERLRKAKRHFRGLVDMLFNRSVTVSDRTLFSIAGKDFLLAAKSYNDTRRTEREREALKRSLMEKVILDARYGKVSQTHYLESLFRDPDIHNCLLAAAYYGRGEIDNAIAQFLAATESNPTPFNYLCLSRCASHGLRDDRQAIERLESALQKFPGDFALTLSIAVAHYHLGNTDRANDYLHPIAEELRTIIRNSDPNIGHLEAEISAALSQKLTVRPTGEKEDSYSEDIVESYWEELFDHMNSLNRFQHGWAGLNHLYQEQIGRILTAIDPGIRQVVNFGVFCANPDYLLAKRFHGTTFVGVDREARTKELNDRAYHAPNLHFLAANIMDVLPDLARRARPLLLFHARTGTLCYPEFLRTLYRACASMGVDYIALWENNSLSRSTLRFHDFEDMSEDSIPYGGTMFIHNYKRYLEEAGFKIIEFERQYSNFDLLESMDCLGDGHIFLLARRLGKGSG